MSKDTDQARSRVGEMLVEEGVISHTALQTALETQKRDGGKLGKTLVDLGLIEETEFLKRFAKELNIPLIDLKSYQIDTDLVPLLPESVARRHQVIVCSRDSKGLWVGMVDPTDLFAMDELTHILKQTLQFALVGESQIAKSLDLGYRGLEQIQEQAIALEEELGRATFTLEGMGQAEMAVDAPVVRILRSLFEEAVRLNASDIHIEPDQDVLRLRKRIDGVLQEQVVQEQRIAPALVSKIKLMAGLEIAEKRRPQDGRFSITVKNHSLDVRVSTLPIQDGESVVLRLLDQSKDHTALETILDPEMLQRFQQILKGQHGLILVTGPTGSGKTTTLYGALQTLNVAGTKIITIEDPVEYRLPRINQVQVNHHVDLTFSNILRTVLRQDPDILLVGEMRDQETAELALRSAMTGHLVFSSLHTNSAVAALMRLLEMGLAGYVVAASVQTILAQRLLRRVCQDCIQPKPATASEQAVIEGVLGSYPKDGMLVSGQGCSSCHFSGYSGRMAVVEMLELSPDLADALRRNDMAALDQAAKMQKQYKPLLHCGLEYALQGKTTLEEALSLMTGVGDEP